MVCPRRSASAFRVSTKPTDGVLIALADMPGITAELVNSLLAAFAESSGRGNSVSDRR